MVYDLISGTILGVLGLDGRGGGLQDSSRALNSCLTNDSGGTSSTGGGGCKGTDAGREEKRTLVWGTGSGTVAVVTSKVPGSGKSSFEGGVNLVVSTEKIIEGGVNMVVLSKKVANMTLAIQKVVVMNNAVLENI